MTGNAHHFGGMHSGFDHSRDSGMAEVMESQAFNFCGLTSCGKPIFEIVLDSNVINRSRCVSSALLINDAPLLKGFFEIQSCRSAKLRIARRISSSRLTEAMLLVVPRTVGTFSLASLNASMSECVMARIRRAPT
jgi:hypothetical protein